MTRTLAQANAEISAVQRMPYGLARTQGAERQVRLVDAEGPEGALAYALAILVESLHWAGEPEKAFLPFTRLVRWWDERPDLFDDSDQHTMFWQFKWMVTDLPDYPTVSAEQIDATLEDMERRFALAGNGRDAVAYSRFMWAWDRGAADVEARFQEWVATPRDDFSQCVVCDPSNRAGYLRSTGRDEEAVRLIEETLAAGGRCSSEPANMLLALALCHLGLGRPQDAARAYRRAVAELARAEGEMTGFRGRRIVFLGLAGQAARAVAAIEEDAALLLDDDVPGSRLGFLHNVAEGITALLPEHADLPVRAAGVPAATLGELQAWVVGQAEALGAVFDARNGTRGNAEKLADALATRPSPTPVDLDLDLLTVVAEAPAARPAVDGAPADIDHLALAEQALASGRTEDAARAYATAAATAMDAGLLVDAGFAFAEAARCAHLLDDDATADALYTRAVAVLRAGRTDPELVVQVVTAWAPTAVATGTALALVEVADALGQTLASDVDAPDEALAERQRTARRRAVADLDDTTARVLASVGGDAATDEAVVRAARAAEAYAGLGAAADAAHAFWLAGRLLDGRGRTDEAVWNLESAVEGFTLTRDRGTRADAASELVALLRRTGQDARAEEVLASLTR